MVNPGDVDQSEAEYRSVGIGCEDARESGGEGHGEVAGDLHQTAERRTSGTQSVITGITGNSFRLIRSTVGPLPAGDIYIVEVIVLVSKQNRSDH